MKRNCDHRCQGKCSDRMRRREENEGEEEKVKRTERENGRVGREKWINRAR